MIQSLKAGLVKKLYWEKYHRSLRAFEQAVPYRNYLPDDDFEKIVGRYAKIPAHTNQDYSTGGMEKLAADRVREVRAMINYSPASVLEIGPGAGYVLKKLKEEGVPKVTGLDIIDQLYPEVKQTGAEIALTSANDMQGVADKSFDLIVSWGALEHIPEPKKVFSECLRVLKPGGYMFHQFGALYYSPWGYHHHSTVRCPYLHLLFPERLIHDYTKAQKGPDYEAYLPWTNGLPIEAYAFMKDPLPYGYLLERYESGFDYTYSDLIREFPEIFKSKNVSFENFFVDWIRIGVSRKV